MYANYQVLLEANYFLEREVGKAIYRRSDVVNARKFWSGLIDNFQSQKIASNNIISFLLAREDYFLHLSLSNEWDFDI